MAKLQKLVVILGPTASGKTGLSLELAKKFKGEIISADSRQIYTKMSVGTAKPDGSWRSVDGKKRYVVAGIPHYAVDLVDPGKTFTVAEFKELSENSIKDIASRKKVPFLVGGTGLYIWSLIDNLDIPKRAPVKKLRESFEAKTTGELAELLKKVDPEAAKIVDKNNKRRLIRALEVVISTGESFVKQRTMSPPVFDVLQIGITWPIDELTKRINRRIDEQWKNGWPEEVKKLSNQKYSFESPSFSGIGYKTIDRFLKDEITKEEAIEILRRDTRRYAKRQLTWFKRDKRIVWINGDNSDEAERLIKEFLNKKTACSDS